MARVPLREPQVPMAEEDTGDGTYDLTVVTGNDRLMLLILRGLFTQPGELRHRPDYGAGLQDFVGRPLTPSNRDKITNRTRLFLGQIEEVSAHVMKLYRDSSTGVTLFDLTVRTRDDRVLEAHSIPIEVPA